MARQFKQFCKVCGSQAVILKTERIHSEISTIYCQCKNPDCLHRWAADVIYSHVLQQSKMEENGIVQYLLSKLPKAELEKIQSAIQLELSLNH